MEFISNTHQREEVVMTGEIDPDGDFTISATVNGIKILLGFIDDDTGKFHVGQFIPSVATLLRNAGFKLDAQNRLDVVY